MQLVVGRIGRPHGVRGAVTIDVHTDDPDLRFAVGSALATDPADVGPLEITSMRWHSGRLLITFEGFADRARAEELRGTWLTIDSAEVASPEDPDEFNDHELIGLAVVTTSGEPVGVVSDVRHQGQDLLVIQPGDERPPASQGQRGDGLLVPFVAAIVPEIDVAAGRLVIDPPPGLLDLAAP